jgi:nitroreductase
MTDSLHLDRTAAEDALAVAVRAPSIHNTQPWSWRLTPDRLVLRADRSRQLEVADPDGHSLLVSCLTELSLRAAGSRVESSMLSDRPTRMRWRCSG